MPNRQSLSRRNFMQQSAALGGGVRGCIRPSASRPGRAREGAEHPLLGGLQFRPGARSLPRPTKGATVKAESLTNDPTMINRLRAGETNVWDLINVNNPWARKVMCPERLIKPLDRARIRALLREDDAGVQAALQMGDGRRAARSCSAWRSASAPTASSSTPTRSAAPTAEDQGWDLWNDPANAGKYGILESDDWNVFNICCIAGFDPFREHTDDEVAKFTETAKRVFKGAKLVGDIATMNQALVSGEIDFHLTGGTYSCLAGARRRLPEHPRHHPEEGPDGRRQGRHLVDRDHLDGQQSRSCRRWPPTSSNMSRTRASRTRWPSPKARSIRSRRWAIRTASSCSPRRSSTRSSGTAWKRRWRRSIEYDIVPDYDKLLDIMTAAKREASGG